MKILTNYNGINIEMTYCAPLNQQEYIWFQLPNVAYVRYVDLQGIKWHPSEYYLNKDAQIFCDKIFAFYRRNKAFS